jgi:membrane fusion protein (multidrug efflux system)
MNKPFLFAALGIAIIAGAGFFTWHNLTSDARNANNMSPAAGDMGGGMAMPVSVMQLQTGTISLTQTLPGRISAFKQSQVRPQVNGIITARLFEEGAEVEKGQQLYQIDDARFKAALISAQADLKSARSTINSIEARTRRYEELVKIDAVSRQEYDDVIAQLDQANAAVEVAKAAVEVARVNLAYTKVYAPISGQIGRSLVTEGALVTANQAEPLSVITQLDPVYVDMQQSGMDTTAIQQARLQGQDSIPVTLMLGDSDQTPYPHEGTLKFSEVTIDQTTGSITLRAIAPNPDKILLPGLFVRAAIGIGEQQAMLVPQRATTRTPDGQISVWVVDSNNQANPRVFQTSGAYKDSWIVSDGLEDGESIIIEGYQKIGPGTEVTPMPWEGTSNTTTAPTTPDAAPDSEALTAAPEDEQTEILIPDEMPEETQPATDVEQETQE